ncbi:hypothetical protein [Schlesneria sp. DSM 10557]|uniref:hypothetical protein n=1 Tax=Schlesneria sp. DSM 10557 TaxID=3044399 RepID=UPI0035A15C19
MQNTDRSVVYWNENVTLRRFMFVSALFLGWLCCDLVAHALSGPGSLEADVWESVQQASGVTIPQSVLKWLPEDSWRLHLYTAYSLPALGLVALILLDRLVNQGKTGLPWGITFCGGIFIVGGAILDIAVTVAHSPDLELEGNPYIRILLDSQHSLTFVYLHALFTQSLYITLFCGLWIGFLRHRQILVETISASSPRNWIEFLKAATGGSHLSIRQWLLPIRPSEAPIVYHCVWLTALPIVFGVSLLRWYAAMEWFGFVEPTLSTRFYVVLHGVVSTLVLYLLALWRLYRLSLNGSQESNSLEL